MVAWGTMEESAVCTTVSHGKALMSLSCNHLMGFRFLADSQQVCLTLPRPSLFGVYTVVNVVNKVYSYLSVPVGPLAQSSRGSGC